MIIGFNDIKFAAAACKALHGEMRVDIQPSNPLVCAVNYTVPRGHCFKCFNLRFPMVSKGHQGRHCPHTDPAPCEVCHELHVEEQCGWQTQREQVRHNYDVITDRDRQKAAAARSHALSQMSAALGGSQAGASQAEYHELSQHRLQDWSSQSPQGQPQPRQRNRQYRTPPSGGSRTGSAQASTPGSGSHAGSRGRGPTPPSEGQQSYHGQGWGKADAAPTSPVRSAESVLSNRYQWPPSESTGSNIDYTSSYCGSVATTMRQLEPAYAEPPRLNSIARKPRGRRLHPIALPNHLTPPLGAKFANTSRMQPDADSPIQDHPPVCSQAPCIPVYSFFTAVTIKKYPLPILIQS